MKQRDEELINGLVRDLVVRRSGAAKVSDPEFHFMLKACMELLTRGKYDGQTGRIHRAALPVTRAEVERALRASLQQLDREDALVSELGSGANATGTGTHRDVRAGNVILVRPLKAERPPRVAEFALMLIPKKNREHLIGDLEEEYRTVLLLEHGPFWAKVWYWEQTTIAVGFYLWPVLKRVLGLAAIWKVMGG